MCCSSWSAVMQDGAAIHGLQRGACGPRLRRYTDPAAAARRRLPTPMYESVSVPTFLKPRGPPADLPPAAGARACVLAHAVERPGPIRCAAIPTKMSRRNFRSDSFVDCRQPPPQTVATRNVPCYRAAARAPSDLRAGRNVPCSRRGNRPRRRSTPSLASSFPTSNAVCPGNPDGFRYGCLGITRERRACSCVTHSSSRQRPCALSSARPPRNKPHRRPLRPRSRRQPRGRRRTLPRHGRRCPTV